MPGTGLPAPGGARGDEQGSHVGGRRCRHRYARHRVRGNRPMSTGPLGTETETHSSADAKVGTDSSKFKLLSEHTRKEIDHWVAKFPPGRQRSACIAALRATQEQNNGFLTAELMDAIAEYLGLPPIQ